MHGLTEFEDNWHYKVIAGILQDEVERINANKPRKKHIIINICPRAGKSLITSIIFPAWAWLTNPALKIITASYSSTLSTNHARLTRNLITTNWYKSFSDVRLQSDQNQKGFFEVVGGGSKFATSVGGSLLGSGADIIILDDLMKVSDAMSETERENVKNFFNETVRTRLNDPDKGVFIFISQRLHDDDIIGYLLKEHPNDFKHINIPAEVTDNVTHGYLSKYRRNLFFPSRFSRMTLNSLRKALGSYGYSSQYEQDPIPSGGGMVKREWIKVIHSTHPDYYDIIRQPINFTVDTAYTADEKNDPSVIMAYHFYKNVIYVKNILVGYYEFPELLKHVQEFALSNGYTNKSRIFVENKASGSSLVQTMKKNTRLNVMEYKVGTKDKVTRLNDVLPMIESGRLVLLEGSWHESYLEELVRFPKAKNDDQVDVTVMALNKLGMGRYNIL